MFGGEIMNKIIHLGGPSESANFLKKPYPTGGCVLDSIEVENQLKEIKSQLPYGGTPDPFINDEVAYDSHGRPIHF